MQNSYSETQQQSSDIQLWCSIGSIIFEKYKIISFISQGTFGQVYLSTEVNQSSSSSSSNNNNNNEQQQQQFAIKVIQKKFSNFDHLEKEIQIQLSLKNQNICKLYEYFQNENLVYLVQEYCNQGSLSSFIDNKPILEPLTISYMKQIIDAFKYIHNKNFKAYQNQVIVHRDLKLENIFVNQNQNDQITLLIGDFGLATFIQKNKLMNHSIVGSPYNMAPECAIYQIYDERADIYSLGVIFYQLLYGDYPYKPDIFNQYSSQIYEEIANIAKNQPLKFNINNIEVTKQTKDLLKLMICFKPKDRIKFEELFNHPYFIDNAQLQQNQKQLQQLQPLEEQKEQKQSIYSELNENFSNKADYSNQTYTISQKLKQINIQLISTKIKFANDIISRICKNNKESNMESSFHQRFSYFNQNQSSILKDSADLRQDIEKKIIFKSEDQTYILKFLACSNQSLFNKILVGQEWREQNIILLLIDIEEEYNNSLNLLQEWVKEIKQNKVKHFMLIRILIFREVIFEPFFKTISEVYENISDFQIKENKLSEDDWYISIQKIDSKNQDEEIQSTLVNILKEYEEKYNKKINLVDYELNNTTTSLQQKKKRNLKKKPCC